MLRKIASRPDEALGGIRVPKKYVKAAQNQFEGALRKDFEQSTDENCEGLLLIGDTGSRKTTFGTKVMLARLPYHVKNGEIDAMWETAPNIITEIKGTFNSNAKNTEVGVVKKYSEKGMLMIDDLGAEKESDWSISMFYSIISNRINWERFTIVTTNLSMGQLKAWNPRIASRLASFHVLDMGNKDYRIIEEEKENTK